MKKFVIVIISFLVLFVFLMLNYLLWDKENLLKQRDSDRIEQDWLRGQNRMLQTTVEEQEKSIKALENQIDTQKNRILELEQQIRLALEREKTYQQEKLAMEDAVGLYKSFMSEELMAVLQEWFGYISKQKLEESFSMLDRDFALWGRSLDQEQYIRYLSAVKSISLQEQPAEEDGKPFAILEEQGEALVIKTRVLINASVASGGKEAFTDIKDGNNTLEVLFRYNSDVGKWAIMSVNTLKIGKP